METQSKRRAKKSRPARRSLEEFALPANNAIAETSPRAPLPTGEPAPSPIVDPAPAAIKSAGSLHLENEKNVPAVAPAAEAADQSLVQDEHFAKAEYLAKAYQLTAANIDTAWQFARRLVKVKTPSEFVELSMIHAREQLEQIVKQAADLGSIAYRLAISNVPGLAGTRTDRER